MVETCPVMGVSLVYEIGDNKSSKLPSSPSCDRIDNSRGYVKGNVIIVSSVINRVKCDLSLEELPHVMERIINFYSKGIK